MVAIVPIWTEQWETRHAMVIPSRITPFSSDHGRQTGLGQISTTLGDHAGISGAVAFWLRVTRGGQSFCSACADTARRPA